VPLSNKQTNSGCYLFNVYLCLPPETTRQEYFVNHTQRPTQWPSLADMLLIDVQVLNIDIMFLQLQFVNFICYKYVDILRHPLDIEGTLARKNARIFWSDSSESNK